MKSCMRVLIYGPLYTTRTHACPPQLNGERVRQNMTQYAGLNMRTHTEKGLTRTSPCSHISLLNVLADPLMVADWLALPPLTTFLKRTSVLA